MIGAGFEMVTGTKSAPEDVLPSTLVLHYFHMGKVLMPESMIHNEITKKDHSGYHPSTSEIDSYSVYLGWFLLWSGRNEQIVEKLSQY